MTSIVRDSARLLGANVFAQAVGLLVYPVLTRLYSPDDFGLLNLFMSIGGVLVLLSTVDYHNAIVLPKSDQRSRSLIHLCVGLLLVLMAVVLLTVPFSHAISSLFKTPELSSWWWLMPLYVGGLGLWNIVSNYFIRLAEFRRISVYQVSQSILNAGAKIGLGVLGWLSGGLLLATIFAPFLAIVLSLCKGGKHLMKSLLPVDKEECKKAAREYSNFPRYSLPRSLVNILGANLPVLLLTPVFGTTEMGYFGMAITLAFRPLQMIVQSIYQVFFQRTAQLVNEQKQISKLLHGYILRAILVLLPSFVVLWFVLPQLTEWLLGVGWHTCGDYIRLLLPWLLLMGLTGPLTFITDIFKLQRPAFWVEVSYMVIRLLAILTGIALHDFRLTLLLYVSASALVITGQLIWFVTIIYRYEKSRLNHLAR